MMRYIIIVPTMRIPTITTSLKRISCHTSSQPADSSIFFEQNDKKHQYLRATEIGIVNAYRWAANAQVAFEKVDQALGYKPKSCLIRLIIKLIKKRACQEGESYLPRLQKAIHSSNICTFSSFMIQK